MLNEALRDARLHVSLPRGSSLRFLRRSGDLATGAPDAGAPRAGSDPITGSVERARIELARAEDLLAAVREEGDLALVVVPAPMDQQVTLAAALADALASRADLASERPSTISLQGCILVVVAEWSVVLAPVEELERAAAAAAEASFESLALVRMEREVLATWPLAHQAAPIAFRAQVEHLGQRAEYARSYAALVALQESHARLGQRILLPQVYPPTLASQVLERVRDRLRVEARHEALEAHIEAQNDVFSRCGERLSELEQARRGHQLEWLIILVLVVQTVLWIIEALSSVGAS